MRNFNDIKGGEGLGEYYQTVPGATRGNEEIEVFFRIMKHHLNVEKEAKGRDETCTKVISGA
ncbi:MAG: hypothetical protein GQ542_03995 [Desulforhopalus sp.]|nr:hypothetical protein [Desulforhopalus sp.]